MVKNETDPERRAIALAWLFHLVGDIHQSLHTVQLFTVEYPKGDRGFTSCTTISVGFIKLRVTPAMEAGISNHVWSLEEIAKLN